MSESTEVSLNEFRTVLSLVDSDSVVSPKIHEGVTAEGLDHAFRKNKLSTGAIVDADIEAKITKEAPLDEGIEEHREQRKRWEERLEWTLPILENAGVDYLVIKDLQNPYAIMADVDVLVPDPDDVVRIGEAMVDEGYTLKQSRLLCHPLKINAHKYVDGVNNPLDIYPDVIWVRKKVADGETVLRRGEHRDIGETTAPSPSPEDSFTIVGTHAHAHLRLTLAEVLHGLSVIENAQSFNWDRVVNLAEKYGTMDSTYIYCRAIDEYCTLYRESSPIPTWVSEDLLQATAARRSKEWFDTEVTDPFTLPFYVPHRLGCVESSIHYLTRSLGSMSLGDSIYGTLTHYVILANQVI